MGRFITLIRNANHLLGVILLLLVSSTPVWAAAQRPVEESEGTQADWVMSYALVILSIGLAVFVVSRPGRRGKTIRRPV